MIGLEILTSAVGLVAEWRIQATLPQTSGTLHVAGLRSAVQVIRDRYGVPHIIAQNANDLAFAQGFVTEQDRGYQLEQVLRLVTGRLAEVYGSGPSDIYLQTDIFFRTLDFDAASRQEYAGLDAATRDQLQAYAAGVNSANAYQAHPIEDSLGSSSPIVWQPWYSLDVARLLSFGFSDWFIKVIHGEIATQGQSLITQAYPPVSAIKSHCACRHVRNYHTGHTVDRRRSKHGQRRARALDHTGCDAHCLRPNCADRWIRGGTPRKQQLGRRWEHDTERCSYRIRRPARAYSVARILVPDRTQHSAGARWSPYRGRDRREPSGIPRNYPRKKPLGRLVSYNCRRIVRIALRAQSWYLRYRQVSVR